jgi:inhibitor of KinA
MPGAVRAFFMAETFSFPRFLDLGDNALTVEFGTGINPTLMKHVMQLDQYLHAQRTHLRGFIETVPTYRSLTIFYDPLLITRAELEPMIQKWIHSPMISADQRKRCWRLPIAYGGEYGPDLADIATRSGLTETNVIKLHSQKRYQVYMLGFLPGFAFMGDVVPILRHPRRNIPRVRVPAGSLGVAGQQTAIYPCESPGGWHLICRCPVRLFNPNNAAPALLKAGDSVEFMPISAQEFQQLETSLRHDEHGMREYLCHCIDQEG